MRSINYRLQLTKKDTLWTHIHPLSWTTIFITSNVQNYLTTSQVVHKFMHSKEHQFGIVFIFFSEKTKNLFGFLQYSESTAKMFSNWQNLFYSENKNYEYFLTYYYFCFWKHQKKRKRNDNDNNSKLFYSNYPQTASHTSFKRGKKVHMLWTRYRLLILLLT